MWSRLLYLSITLQCVNQIKISIPGCSQQTFPQSSTPTRDSGIPPEISHVHSVIQCQSCDSTKKLLNDVQKELIETGLEHSQKTKDLQTDLTDKQNKIGQLELKIRNVETHANDVKKELKTKIEQLKQKK